MDLQRRNNITVEKQQSLTLCNTMNHNLADLMANITDFRNCFNDLFIPMTFIVFKKVFGIFVESISYNKGSEKYI